MTTKRKQLYLRHRKKLLSKLAKRKMNPEFTTAVRVAKLIRISCCNSAIMMQPDRNRFRRLAKFILHTIIHADRSHRHSERQILTHNLKAFEGYELNPDAPFSECILAPYTTTISRRDHHLTISIPSFTAATQIIWPPGSTHCKLTALGAAFDFRYFSATQGSASTGWIAKNQGMVPPVYLTIYLSHTTYLPLFLVMGIAFISDKEETPICHSVQIVQVNC